MELEAVVVVLLPAASVVLVALKMVGPGEPGAAAEAVAGPKKERLQQQEMAE